jgi:hypothetical protein
VVGAFEREEVDLGFGMGQGWSVCCHRVSMTVVCTVCTPLRIVHGYEGWLGLWTVI